MNYFKYILLFCLILFPITSKSYGLTNSWCSNGKYSKAISPFPKPQFNKCPGYAKIIMTKKEVTDYYLNGLGKDYLCKLTSNPLFFVGSKHKREDYEALKLLFKPNQVKVAVMCAQLNRTKLAKKKAEEAKQTARVHVNKGPKEWCLPQNKYQRNIPFHKLEDGNKCPSNTKQISQEKALNLFLTNYDGYLNQIIVSGTICNDTYKNYKYLRELIREEKNLDCNRIKAELLKKNQEKEEKAIAQKKAEEEAKIKALAEKLAKEEIAKQLKQKEEDARKKAEELAKQKAIEAKKAEEEALKKKILYEKIAKIKDKAQFIVETLKEYVTTDNNKLDILEVSELLENYDNEKQKGWSDTTIEKFEALYDYVQKDDGFVTYSSEKKSKKLAAYNEEIRQLREYLSSSQSSLKEFITKNLGSKNAKEALKLAKETKAILKDFDVTKAIFLKNDISTWKAMNGVKEDKKYSFKLLNKKSGLKNVKKSSAKASSSISSSKALNTSPIVNEGDDGKFEKEYKRSKKKINQNKSQLKVGDFPEFLIGKTWFSSSVYNRSRLSCNEVYRKAKNVIGYTRYESKNMYSYIRSKISSMRPMDSESKATIEVIETGNKTRFKVVSQRFITKDGMCYTTSIKEYDPSNETLKNIGCSSTYCSVTGNNNRLNKTRCLNKGNVSNYCFGYPSR